MYTPTDREQQRYVCYDGPSPLPTYRTLFGVYGEAAAGIQHKQPTVIRVNAQHVDHVKAAICLTPGCRSVSVTANITKAKTQKKREQ